MKIIALSGLGADHRVFQFLDIGQEIQVIKWVPPSKTDSFESYAKKLLPQIDPDEEYILLALSFGGLLAKEFQTLLNIKKVILISTVSQPEQLPLHFRLAAKLGVLRLIPDFLIVPPAAIMRIFFQPGRTHRKMFNSIIRDTNPHFAKWAALILISWDNKEDWTVEMHHLHGSHDWVLPCPKDPKIHVLEGAHHLMVMNRNTEMSQLICDIIADKNDIV